MGKKIEGYWDCPVCRTKAIKGRFTECPNCGKPRGENTNFYMIEKDNYVDNSDVEKGPDWMCDYCNSYNPFSVNFCLRCGSPREDSKDDYFSIQKRNKENTNITTTAPNQPFTSTKITNTPISETNYTYPSTENKEQSITEKDQNRSQTGSSNTPLKSFFEFLSSVPSTIADFISEYRNILIGIVSVLAVIGIFVFIFHPRQDTLEVTGVNWERSIEIEEYKTVRESDWSLPPGGRLAYSQDEYYGKKSVLDHYETVTEQKSERYVSGQKPVVKGYKNLGNGYFEEIIEYEDIYDTRYYTVTKKEPVYKDVDVYKTKYYYDIERWVHKTTLYESGISDPFWPEVNLSSNERTGSKQENYTITGINKKNKTKTYSTSYTLWNDVKVGNTIDVTIVAGTITKISFPN